ncbi:MAG: COX15/CtaA family protein [Chitinophagaceae bacterium]|nr:COX15/CtaA family protein [Chitinophagaceae bacterium]
MTTDSLRSNKAVSNWLLFGVFMLIVQILLGGITRLSGSGLSITEWDVVTGTLPPLSKTAWLAEFDKYKNTPQFQLLNSDFTLKDFQFIFFWEWFHRLWARLMGMVFATGFIYFLVKRYFKKEMVTPLIILFILGALQGAVGWIMVASGLVGDAVYVKPTKLALHFILAMGLLCYTFWFALQLKVKKEDITVSKPISNFTWALLLLLIVQLLFGALMAGHKAATAAPTWPMINDAWIPAQLFKESPLLINFIENKITIHFIHRNLAYLLLLLVIVWYFTTAKVKGSSLFTATRFIPLLITLLQVLLGVLSVLTSLQIIPNRWGVFEWMAQLHQLTGMCLLLSLVWVLYLVRRA